MAYDERLANRIRRAFSGGGDTTERKMFGMYVVAPMMGLRMDIAAMMGSMLGGSWTAGLMMYSGHLLYGSLLGIIASAPEPRVAHA